ncbi:MAG: LacI family DNA-binding transcriptional regulator [Planctomycetes bacterium]|nr:LacI family DNA-binding transcriptional regulator [Planctomycetota bacterium]
MARITIYDIAQELSISTSTVSRVLNGSSLISEETSQIIRDTAERLGYQKRRIRRQRERAVLNIKIILPKRQASHLHLFYDHTELLCGIKNGLEPARANLVSEVDDDHLDLFSHKKGGDIDGVIFAFTTASSAIYNTLSSRNIPNLTLNRRLEGQECISCDYSAGMFTLMQQIKLNRKNLRPLFIQLSAVPDLARHRFQAMAAACNDLNIEFNEEQDIHTVDDASHIDQSIIRHAIDHHYNCLVCFNDLIAVSLMQKAQAAGINIPQDISITGFDNSPLTELFEPRLSTMSLPVYELGQEAGAWIHERIINRNPQTWRKRIESTYIPGNSI